MTFCRECGKKVEKDWVTCPFCSETIGPPRIVSANINDSLVMGNVITTVNASKSITTAVKTASKCPKCDSVGSEQIACSVCKEIAYCSVCFNDFKKNIRPEVESVIGEKIWMDYDKWFSELPRLCMNCFSKRLK